jgi:multiple sugar transport system permease protein
MGILRWRAKVGALNIMATATKSNRFFWQARGHASDRTKRDGWFYIGTGTALTILTLLAILYLAPLVFMVNTSFKNAPQLADPAKPLLPMSIKMFNYQGKDLTIYRVPTDSGIRELALFESTRRASTFIDPAAPDAEKIVVPVRAATLEKVTFFDPHPETYTVAVDEKHLYFVRAFMNTLAVAGISAIGAVTSAALVAYGFSRFNIPGGNVLFLVLLSTIVLPPQVTLIPAFIVFQKIGWVGTLLPLIVPHFFSNAYNVFLLRQYFLSIPTEMDEAARVDGANPIQTFLWVIVPQARVALVTVILFHFLVIWGEFYNALIYTTSSPEAQPLSVALQRFTQLYSAQPNMMMAGSLLTMLLPMVIFFFAQRTFMQGIVITGVDK